jgi:hypothetical protein
MSRICTDIETELPPPNTTDPWNGLPPPRPWGDIDRELKEGLIKPPQQIIHGMLYRGGKMLVSASSKARKTWLLLHIGACVAGGRTWLGFDTTKVPVLYLDLELLPHEAPMRQRLIMEAAGIWNMDDFHIWQLRGQRLSMQRLKGALLEYCRTHEIGLIIIDPWYKLSGGADEIGTEGVSDLLSHIEEIASSLKSAVIISHHFTKGDSSHKNVIDLASGTGVFGRDPDLICGMRELADSTEEFPLVKMEFVARSFKPVKPVGLRWKFPMWERDDQLDLKLKVPGSPGRTAEATVDNILEVLGDRTLTVSDWEALCVEKFSISERTFKRLKAQALLGQFIETQKNGRSVQCRRVPDTTRPDILSPKSPPQERLRFNT